jgi:NADH dehydrogenase (ubiquinone) Fe-S protein 6
MRCDDVQSNQMSAFRATRHSATLDDIADAHPVAATTHHHHHHQSALCIPQHPSHNLHSVVYSTQPVAMSLLRPLRPLRDLRVFRSPRLLATYSSATTLPTPSKPAGSHQPDGSTPRELQQSPNVATTWSRGQMPKPLAYDSPRFEQTDLDLQPNAPSAMGMVAEDPVRLVHGRKAVCEGGE